MNYRGGGGIAHHAVTSMKKTMTRHTKKLFIALAATENLSLCLISD
jgi:hypothetical protein